jgi:hypothetical protein
MNFSQHIMKDIDDSNKHYYESDDMKLVSKSFYDRNFNPSILHALYDTYLPPGIGNLLNKSRIFFSNAFADFVESSDGLPLDNELVISIKLALKTAKYGELVKMPINLQYIKQIISTSILRSYIYSINSTIKAINTKIDWKVTLPFLLTLFQTTNISSKLLEHLYQPENVVIPDSNLMILLSGWNAEDEGHMITFICIKNGATNTVYLVNSGDGIGNHPINENQLPICIIKNELDNEKFKKLIYLVDFFNKYLIIENSEEFYNSLIEFVEFNLSSTEDLYNVKPQLSSSCTYFALLYAFKILFKDNVIFNNFKEFVEQYSHNKLEKFIEYNYINRKIILPNILANYINMSPYKSRSRVLKHVADSTILYNEAMFQKKTDYCIINICKHQLVKDDDMTLNININELVLNDFTNAVNTLKFYDSDLIKQTMIIWYIASCVNILLDKIEDYVINFDEFIKLCKELYSIINTSRNIGIVREPLSFIFFLFLIKLNGKNNIFSMPEIKPEIPSGFKLDFYKLHANNVFHFFTEEDYKLITDYYYLFGINLVVNNKIVEIPFIKYINSKISSKKAIIKFLLQFYDYNYESFSDVLSTADGNNFVYYSYKIDENIGTCTFDQAIQGNHMRMVRVTDTSDTQSQILENIFSVLKSGDLSNLDSAATFLDSINVQKEFTFNDIVNPSLLLSESGIDFISFNGLELVFEQFMQSIECFNHNTILIIMYIIIKYNVNLLRDNNNVGKILINLKKIESEEMLCFNIINSIIDGTFTFIDTSIKIRNPLTWEYIELYVKYCSQHINENLTQNTNVTKILNKIYTEHEILTKTVLSQNLMSYNFNSSIEEIIKKDYILVQDNVTLTKTLYNIFTREYLDLQGIKKRRLFKEEEYIMKYHNIQNKTITHFYNVEFFNILTTYFGNTVIFFEETTEIIIYFCGIYVNNSQFIMKYNKTTENIQVIYGDESYYLTRRQIPMYTRWVVGIPYCFILRKGSTYKLLIIENMEHILYSINGLNDTHYNKNKFSELNIELSKKHRNRVFIVEFNPFGLSLNFVDNEAIQTYSLLCMIYYKSDCLQTFFNQLININNLNPIIIKLIRNGCNSQYSAYFKSLYDPIYYYEYEDRLYNYQSSYNVNNKIDKTKINVGNFRRIEQVNDYYKYIEEAPSVNMKSNFNYDMAQVNSNLDDTINFYVSRYLDIYDKCESAEIVHQYEIKDTSHYDERKIKLMLDIYINLLNNKNNLIQNICTMAENYYKILEIDAVNEFYEDIGEKPICDKAKKIYNNLSLSKLYTSLNREIEVVFFEICFGKLIRNDQHNLYNTILKNLDDKNGYNIYQLLMGKGKTSVILPILTIFNNLFSIKNNTIICLPQHLVTQTYNDLLKYQVIMSGALIKTNLELYNKNIAIVNSITLQKIVLKSANVENIEEIYLKRNIKNNSLLIIDEFDSLYDPLSSELNYPINSFKVGEKNPMTQIFENYMELIFGKNIILHSKAMSIYKFCSSQVYGLNYGFGTSDTHKDLFIAVPYAAVNKPVNGSYFSDLDITITLTTMAYLNLGYIREIDLCNMLLLLKNKFKEYIKFTEVNNRSDNIFGEYENYIPAEILKNNLEGKVSCEHLYSQLDVKNIDFLKLYVTDIVIPNIKYSTKNYNCSFIDVMNENFSLKKIAFSGTFNIDLPKFASNSNEFINIIKNDADNGSMYYSMLNKESDDDNKIEVVSGNERLTSLLNIIKNKKCSVLIDCGGFLKDYSMENVVKFIESTLKKKYVICIDKDDKKLVYTSKQFLPYSGEQYSEEALFIYYDNQHTVGIDIKQPFNLSGVITIDKFNRFTGISQGMYRLRNLNFGHIIVPVISKELSDILGDEVNRMQLLKHLLQKDADYKNVALKRKMLQQNIKYLYREIAGMSLDSYIAIKEGNIDYSKDNLVLPDYNQILGNDEVSSNSLSNIIPNKEVTKYTYNVVLKNAINQYKNSRIVLLKSLVSQYNTLCLNQEIVIGQEQEQEQEQAKENINLNGFFQVSARNDVIRPYIIDGKEFQIISDNNQELLFLTSKEILINKMFGAFSYLPVTTNSVATGYIIDNDVFILVNGSTITKLENENALINLKYRLNSSPKYTFIDKNYSKEMFVRFILGSILTFKETMYALKFMCENSITIRNLQYFNNIFYKLNFTASIFIDNILNSKYVSFNEVVKNQLSKDPYVIYKEFTGSNLMGVDNLVVNNIANTLSEMDKLVV